MKHKFYTGCVEDRNDPLKLGRCQVRIVGLHTEDKTVLPTKDLPWAFPVTPITSAGVSGVGSSPIGPVEGTWVLIMFMDPDEQMPIMMGTLGGVAQIKNSTDDPGKVVVNQYDPDGTVSNQDQTQGGKAAIGSKGTNGAKSSAGEAGSSATPSTAPGMAVKEGKIIANGSSIVGPLANLIAKAESGNKGYNAFNRGTSGGKIVPAGGNLELTKMTIKDIMAKQALPPGSPDRLFAVGKYQCIPDTLIAACKALNISHDQCFTEQTQDIICQEFLVAKKRPPLVAYYRNPDKNNEKLLKDAGRSLAMEFSSIEDPYNLGYPYGGPEGKYYKSGNRAHTMFAQIKTTLIKEWEFRNNPKAVPPTASLGGNDKVDKGTDYTGVESNKPLDTSVKTPATKSSASQADIPVDAPPAVPGLDNAVPGLGDVGGGALAELPNIGGVLSGINIPTDILNIAKDIQASFTTLNSAFGDLTKDINSVLNQFGSGASSMLTQFGGSISEITQNLGIPNVSGTTAELAANLGLYNATPQALVKELENIAGSPQGQARAMLTKLNTEPTVPQVAPIGQKNPDGTTSTGSNVDPTKGFQDPNGVYPKYKNEQDTNRLASGNNLGRTIVLKKEATVETGVKIANGGTWDQSPTPYNAKYPFNHVTQTESGHTTEFDDTPGCERIHFYHKAGTFWEIDANGTQVNKIVGDGYEIIERNGFVYVKGALNVTVDGAMNLRTDNVFNLEVSGAANINIYNNANVNVSGSVNMGVGGAFNVHANQINLESAGQFNIKAKTGLNIEAGSDLNFRTEGTAYLEADGNFNAKSAGQFNIETDSDANIKSAGLVNVESADATNIKSGADTNIESGGTMSLLASGSVAIDGSDIDMANGAAASAGGAAGATPANKAGLAEVEIPVETRAGSGTAFLPPLSLNTRGTETAYEDNTPKDAGAYAAYRSSRISNNEASSTNMGAQKYVQDSSAPTAKSATSGIATDAAAILNMDPSAFNAGMRLSPNWTLGELTANGTRIPRTTYQVKNTQRDTSTVAITAQEIVANLQALAVNVLEPLTEKYGKGSFRINSCFRRPPLGNQMGDLGRPDWGDHTKGCAVDITFTGGKVKNYEICKTLPGYLKSWNQIIMEYDNPTDQKGHWIHISYRRQGNSGHCFTMNNHQMCVAGVNAGFILV